MPLPIGLERAWDGITATSTRGPRPAYTLEQVVSATVGLGDAEGIVGMSLGRVADHLGLTTNAMYRYVSSRDELHVLAREVGLGDPPAISRDDWRAGVREWAHALRERYRAHPWLLDVAVRLPTSPRTLMWLEAALEALSGTGLDTTTTLQVVTLVDGFVRAASQTERDLLTAGESFDPSVGEFIAPRLVTRNLEHVAALVSDGYLSRPPGPPGADFEFGLACLLDGIETRTAAAG
ncbi:tetracycline repressor-like protein [Diaminobutyricimonas aerilata]|uniref:Tetracycline repressor-like protein n=1 Tax=Diaminobutyricimonas aerilata TaxID=1162967 RepID=A0A2M9CFC0_9MICO|nr:TetR/AcrR family transcriptional regulator C-terminal domain-containing protein [Diaminobutyricimonas aerilata]PJJ70634.1 tetracycline repressor-like protein [Diaminobutyricimonas aerilata]